MDPTRFDSLTRAIIEKSFSDNGTRRALLGSATALALSGILTGFFGSADAAKKKKRKCAKPSQKGTTLCRGTGGGCRDLRSDPAHCGMCFRACAPGQTCAAGVCTGVNSACTPNCQGKICGADDSCGGICASGSCPAGKTCRSDGACVTGGCNPVCGFNSTCQNGTCVPAANYCPTTYACTNFENPIAVCGSTAVNGLCNCVKSTEGNNVCINYTDSRGFELDPSQFVTCTSTQQCRETVGFGFFCHALNQAPNGNFCGPDVPRCYPQCDAPDIGFRAAEGDEPALVNAAQAEKKRQRGRKNKRNRSSRR